MRLAFIINSRIQRLQDFEIQFRTCDHGLIRNSTRFYTQYPKHAIELSEQAGEYDIIVAVGGDGTLNEVVNGLMNLETRPSVGLLPYGSANDFGRERKLTNKLNAFFKMVDSDCTSPVDVGQIKFPEESRIIHFINIADIGFGADVVYRLSKNNRWYSRLNSKIKFSIAIIRTFFSYSHQYVTVKADDNSWEGNILSVIVANSRSFGGGLIIAPEAKISSGKFQLIILGDISLIDYFIYLKRIRRGDKIRHSEAFYSESSVVKITGRSNLKVEADGELAGQLPAEIRCIPKALNFYCYNQKQQ